MSRRAVGVNSQLARFNRSETPPRSRGGVLTVEAHAVVHKFMINMIDWQLQKKPVLSERVADAARQHAHIDTNRAYNDTTRDRTYSSLLQT